MMTINAGRPKLVHRGQARPRSDLSAVQRNRRDASVFPASAYQRRTG